MTRVAVYDCGTNTTRLLVADIDGNDVKIIERQCVITGLGKGVDASGLLDPDSIERVAKTLKKYAQVASGHSVNKTNLIATSAVRDAANADEFALAVEEVAGCRMQLLSGEQEGKLMFRGATTDVPWSEPTVLLDIGGGSTEVVYGVPGQDPEVIVSLQMGAVRTTEQFLEHDPPSAEELSQAVSVIRDEFEDLARQHPQIREAKKLVGVAGTVTTAAAVEIGLEPYDSEAIHLFELTKPAAEDVFRTLATEPLAARIKNPGLEPDRADVIVGGLIILVTFMRVFDFDVCIASERDLLDGVAATLS